MPRIAEYYRDPDPPPVRGLVVLAYAIVRDETGQVLLVRRSDDGNWELPGGRVEAGETTSTTIRREVAEESGITITITGVSGIYSDPAHIVVYRDEGALQQHAVCLHARPDPAHQQPRPDGVETTDAAWFPPTTTRTLPMQPDVRRRLHDAVDHPDRAHVD